MTRQSGSMSRYSMNVHASRYTPASAGLGVLNWLAIVPDEPPRAKGIYLWTPPRPKDLTLSSLTPLLVTQLVLGGIVRSSLTRLTPTSYLGVAYGGSLRCSYPSGPGLTRVGRGSSFHKCIYGRHTFVNVYLIVYCVPASHLQLLPTGHFKFTHINHILSI